MQVLVNLSGETSGWLAHSRKLGLAIRPVLEALVTVNQLYLVTHHVPKLYESGVRYGEEPNGTIEEFASIPIVLSRGWGDCDDLSPWRVAELRCQGEKAKIRIQWKRQGNGKKLFHIVVRRANGEIEDPSRILGMGKLAPVIHHPAAGVPHPRRALVAGASNLWEPA